MKFVLVHGAWHHGGHWKPVREYLEAEGHEVHTPTIGGLQPGVNTQEYPELETAYAPVLAYILDNNLSDYSLLSHSYGGMIISKLALKLNGTKNQPNRLVYQNAFVPGDGESCFDMVEDPGRLKASNDRTNDKLAREVYDTLAPVPFGQRADKLSMKGFDTLECAKSYILADNDVALESNSSGKWLWDVMPTKLQGPYNLVKIEPADHEVMFTNPILLVQKIIEAGSGGGKRYEAGTLVIR